MSKGIFENYVKKKNNNIAIMHSFIHLRTIKAYILGYRIFYEKEVSYYLDIFNTRHNIFRDSFVQHFFVSLLL